MPAPYVTVAQQVICKHLHMRAISIAQAADVVHRLALTAAGDGVELEVGRKLREDLERRTGKTIGDLAAIAAADWV